MMARLVIPALLLTVYPFLGASWNYPPPAAASQDLDVFQRRDDLADNRLLHAVTLPSSIEARGEGLEPRDDSIFHYIDSGCS